MTFRAGQELQLKSGFNLGTYRVFNKKGNFPLPAHVSVVGQGIGDGASGGVTGDLYTTLRVGNNAPFKVLSSFAEHAYEPKN